MDDCIIHPNKPHPTGYVFLRYKGRRSIGAHRIAYIEAYGAIPDGLIVRHKCDVKNCINPHHLEVGTHKDNTRDMWDRGREFKHPLTPEEALEIRASTEQGKALAERYGVSQALITRIRNGERWINI